MNNEYVPQSEEWVDQFGDDLYRYAYSRLKDTHLAEDLVQETLISDSMDCQLTFHEKSALRFHLLICSMCRRARK